MSLVCGGLQGDPVREFGQQLQAAGYSYHGGETMISGITGEEFKVRRGCGLAVLPHRHL